MYLIVIWLVVCPLCQHTYRDVWDKYYGDATEKSHNFIPCEKCRIVLDQRPIKITKVTEKYLPGENEFTVTIKEEKEVIFEDENYREDGTVCQAKSLMKWISLPRTK